MPDSNWVMCKGNLGLADVMCILKQKTKCLNEKKILKLECNFSLKERMFINDVQIRSQDECFCLRKNSFSVSLEISFTYKQCDCMLRRNRYSFD